MLGGCSGVHAIPTPTPTHLASAAGREFVPSPTPEADDTTSPLPTLPPMSTPGPGTLVIAGESLVIYPVDGTPKRVLEYTLPSETVIAALSDLFGSEPVVSTVAEEFCAPGYEKHAWGNVSALTEFAWLPDQATVEVDALTASQSGIAIVSSLGVGVGDDATAAFASQPREFGDQGEDDGKTFFELYFDVVDSLGPSAAGEIWGEDMVVEGVAAPIVPWAAGGC